MFTISVSHSADSPDSVIFFPRSQVEPGNEGEKEIGSPLKITFSKTFKKFKNSLHDLTTVHSLPEAGLRIVLHGEQQSAES